MKTGGATGWMWGKKNKVPFFSNLSLAMWQMNGKDDQRDVPLYTPLKSSLLDRNLFRRLVNASQAKPAGRIC